MISSKDIKLFKWIFAQVRPHWPKALLSGIAVTCVASLEPILPALMQPLVDESLIGKDTSSMWQIPLAIMLVFLAKGIAEYAAAVASQSLAQTTVAELRSRVFSHELNLPISIHAEQGSGVMLGKITYDTGMIAETVSSAWLVILRDTLVLIGLLSFLLYTAWQLTLLILVTTPIIVYAIRITSKRIRASNIQLQSLIGNLNTLITESHYGLRELKIFAGQATRLQKFNIVNRALRCEQMRIVRSQAANVPLVQIIAAFSVTSVILAASYLSSKNLLTPGQFVAFITAMAMIFEPIRRLTNVNAVIQRGLAAASSILGVLELPTESESSIYPTSKPILKLNDVPPEIVFSAVCFEFTGRDRPVLDRFNLKIAPGETIVLKGPSGAGKSTLLGLIARFHPLASGKITIDGVDIHDIDVSSLRQCISIVSQHTVLFNGSVRENLLLGNAVATSEEIRDAVLSAGLSEFVDSLPLGLNTQIGELGDKLSGGQRQRISIARAILKKASVLLLDEPTSALDQTTADEIVESLQALMLNRTCLLSTHATMKLHIPYREIILTGYHSKSFEAE